MCICPLGPYRQCLCHCHYMPRLTAKAALCYLARSPLIVRLTVSHRSCALYTPSQAAYARVSLLLTKVEHLFSLPAMPVLHDLLCLFSYPLLCLLSYPMSLPL